MKKFTRMVVMVVMTGGLAGQAYAQPMAQPPPPSENAAVWYLTAQYFLSTDLDEQTKAIFDQWQSPDLLAAGRALERMKTPMGYLRQGAELEGRVAGHPKDRQQVPGRAVHIVRLQFELGADRQELCALPQHPQVRQERV